jgi:hypothetical protein
MPVLAPRLCHDVLTIQVQSIHSLELSNRSAAGIELNNLKEGTIDGRLQSVCAEDLLSTLHERIINNKCGLSHRASIPDEWIASCISREQEYILAGDDDGEIVLVDDDQFNGRQAAQRRQPAVEDPALGS